MIFMAGRLINQHFGPIDVRGINASEAVRKQTLLKQELNNDKIAGFQVIFTELSNYRVHRPRSGASSLISMGS